MAVLAGLDAGSVDPKAREFDILELPMPKVGNLVVEGLAYAADLAGAHLADARLGRCLLDLSGGCAGGAHLGHGGNDGTVRARAPLDDVIGKAAAHAQLGDPHRDLSDAGGEPALAAAVAAVAILAKHIGLRGHDLVDERFGERSAEFS